jgi:hypothetical protein
MAVIPAACQVLYSRAMIEGLRQATPLVRVLVAQATGAVLALALAFCSAVWLGFAGDLFILGATAGVIAAWVGDRYFHLPRWWIPGQMAMLPGAFLVTSFALPSWIYLAAFVVVLAVYWNAARWRVPLYLTNATAHRALAELMPPNARVIDLGHGFGGTVLALAAARPDLTVEGLESAPIPYALSRLHALLKPRAKAWLGYGNFWRRTIARYDVVYAFLSPVPMQALYSKAQAEMRPGTLFVTNSFPVPARAADDVKILADRRGTRLFIYRM